MKFAADQRGSVLVVVLLALLTLSIMGTSLSSLTVNDNLHAVRQQRSNEAYYIARSGAEAVAEVLLADVQNIANYIGQTTTGELGSGWFEAEVKDGVSGNILIHSTGYAGGYSEKVTLSLIKEGGDNPEGPGGGGSGSFIPVFDMAVFSLGPLKLLPSAKVHGNVGTNSIEPGAVFFDWDTSVENVYIGPGGDADEVVTTPMWSTQQHYQSVSNLPQERQYPEPVFPEFPEGLPQRDDIKDSGNNRDYVIDQPGQYNEIYIAGSCKLTFRVGDSDLKIRVKKITVDGSGVVEIQRNGSGRLILYVEESLTSRAYFNHNGNAAALVIYYKGTTENLVFSEWLKLPAYFFALQADLTVGGSGGLYGTIITLGNNVKIVGDSGSVVQVMYAPTAKVNMEGSGKLLGAIVCREFEAKGGARVTYDSRVDELWDEVPPLEFDFGETPEEPGSGSGSGDSGGSGGSGGSGAVYYRKVWSK
ncbi:MAG: hypothetical protein WBH65_06090 [Dethiobacteria bacterium]